MARSDVEPMKVVTPETLNIEASGTKIAELTRYGNNPDLYIVSDIDQKMELTSFCEMIAQHFRRLNRKIYQLVLETGRGRERTVIWVHLDKEHLPTTRVISDNPQA